MNTEKKSTFLINTAYWLVIAGIVYLAFEYLLPVSVPFILGILIAVLVIRLSGKLRCPHRLFRLGLAIVIYGLLGFLVTVAAAKGISAVTGLIKWLPQVYEIKLLPFITLCYEWCVQKVRLLDPALIGAMDMLMDSLVSAVKNMVSYLSGLAVDVVSGVATGVPSLILSLLAMIFSTVFIVSDYERISAFIRDNVPESVKGIAGNVRIYLTDTLFVVIRSYALIMLLTFTELSILFSLFGIGNAVLKASLIALLDILPILGTGGIMIPWAVISLALGHTALGLKLLFTYIVVTVVRNYVEPKIVGTQLGLHPIITLVSMFIGLRLFGFWGLFGLPVSISFFWKQKKDKQTDKVSSANNCE